MGLLDRFIRAIERNSRSNERRRLIEELEDIYATRDYNDSRAKWIGERLEALGKADLDAYLNRHLPVKSVSQMIEDDCGVPEGLVGEWKAPA